jgi:hypothetical protein
MRWLMVIALVLFSCGRGFSPESAQDIQSEAGEIRGVDTPPTGDIGAEAFGPTGPTWSTCPEYAGDMTLAEKATYLDALMVTQHHPDGLVRSVTLDDAGEVALLHNLPSTGLWTAMYLASQSLRYAVTGDPEAQENAGRAAEGLHHLTAVTGSSGLYGRSYTRPGYPYSGGTAESAAWHASDNPDYAGWFFNHDVSKDTMDGIMFGYAVALEHLDDPEILGTMREDVAAFANHLLDNGLQIIDWHGAVTEHGKMYHSAMDDFPGFNALLVTSWLRTALTESEDPSLEHVYYDCLFRRGDRTDCPPFDPLDIGSYMDSIEVSLAMYLKDCQTSYDHFDMVFHAIYPMLRREEDPDLLPRLMDVLEDDLWNPADTSLDPPFRLSTHSLYIFLYGGLSGKLPEEDPLLDAAIHDGVCTLRRMPVDRSDVDVPKGDQETWCLNRMGDPNAKDIIPLEERRYDNYIWRLDPYEIPQGYTGSPGFVHTAEDWLLAYWVGRYHGFLSAEL